MDLSGTRDIFPHSGTVPGNPGQLVNLLWTGSHLWNSVPIPILPDSLSLPDVPVCFPSTRARQADSTVLAWTCCFGAGWCLSLSLSWVRVSQSVISMTNFKRSKKVDLTIFEKWRTGTAFRCFPAYLYEMPFRCIPVHFEHWLEVNTNLGYT